jgi:RNA polymerase sigma-70 factor (ECF subfamily)
MSFEPAPSKSLTPEAFGRLVGGHRQLLAFLGRRIETRAAAEDTLQSAFACGLERGAGAQDETVVPWFYRVLRNSVIDHYRHRSTSARAMEASGREFAESQETDEALRRQLCGTRAEHGCFDCHCGSRTGLHCEPASA